MQNFTSLYHSSMIASFFDFALLSLTPPFNTATLYDSTFWQPLILTPPINTPPIILIPVFYIIQNLKFPPPSDFTIYHSPPF